LGQRAAVRARQIHERFDSAASHVLALSLALIEILCCVACVNDPEPGSAQHVIIILQENRTPDNLFHGLPNADIANVGVDSHGKTVRLSPVSLTSPYDLNHTHGAFLAMYHDGKMDGADRISAGCIAGEVHCLPRHPQFVYVDPSEVRPYFDLATQYAFADRMFQTNQGPSFPAHQFIIAGTSAPTPTSDLFAAENPFSKSGSSTRFGFSYSYSGCAAPQLWVHMINPAGFESEIHDACFEHSTLMDLLDSKQLSWRYYSVGDSWNVLWNGPAAIRHIRFGSDWTKVVNRNTQILSDIASGQLPNVSWVIPSGQASDHPAINRGEGPSWVSAIVNAVGNSTYWPNTTIFITWDDWGGFYDHVPPPLYNSYEYGFRVPLIVVSPYAKPGYVSHVAHDFGSILRFIEELFNLPNLGFADALADDLSDCFDLQQPPLVFHQIQAPLDAAYFLQDTRRPADPDDD
jgi:phospholipase C